MTLHTIRVVILCFASLVATSHVESLGAETVRTVSADLVLEEGAVLTTPLSIAADGITIDGNGATLRGPGAPGDKAGLVGVGIRLSGRTGVTIKNLSVHGFELGLKADDCEALTVEGCDFSDNYHDPEYGWGDGARNGGMILTRVSKSRFVGNRANRVWNGMDLFDCDENNVRNNDFSRCSNVCLKLWRSSHNQIFDNDLSWGLRIREGEVHARDSTSVLIETGSNDNHFLRNDCTHGGDGIFIRPLNGWQSTGNLFEENDCSFANNNGFESWSPGNAFVRNKANHCSYGFWLGFSDRTVLLGNEASYNGLQDGFHNAPESDFGHGGIVIVNGTGTHTVIQDNDCHQNAGGGIVFRGDLGSRGEQWRMQHLVVQDNRLTGNVYGIFARFTDDLYLAGNQFADNGEDEHFEDIRRLERGDGAGRVPWAVEIVGPNRVVVGDTVVFQAKPTVGGLRFRWMIDDEPFEGPRVERAFASPGFHRVSLTADNGHFARLAAADVYAVLDGPELGTEGGANRFAARQGGVGSGDISIDDDGVAVTGAKSVRVRMKSYLGAEVLVSRPLARSLMEADPSTLSFWLRYRNPNNGFEGPTIVRLHTDQGMFTYVPVERGRPLNLLRDHPYPEARAGWQRAEIPLAGGSGWMRTEGFDGAVPAHYEGDLEITTLATNVETQGSSSLVSDGKALYLATSEGDRLFRSEDGDRFVELSSPRRSLGAAGDWTSGMLAFHAGGPVTGNGDPSGGLFLRMRDPERDPIHGVDGSRLARYDLATNNWSWLPTRMAAGHGSVVCGDYLYAIAHALGANYGGAIERVDLSDPPKFAERTSHGEIAGPDGWWLSRAAQLAEVDGVIYAIKNDWTTPRPEVSGDRLFAFDASEFRPSRFLGGHPWHEDQWEAAYTPVADLGSLPVEIGHGASMVGLPADWCSSVGQSGGLFIVAGSSPSDHEGQGTPSPYFLIYDIGQRKVTQQGDLPAATGTGTSLAFLDGKVFVKRGGMNFPAFNAQLWVIRPVDEEEAALGRETTADRTIRMAAVNRVSFQFDSNGAEPFDLWIDGLRIW